MTIDSDNHSTSTANQQRCDNNAWSLLAGSAMRGGLAIVSHSLRALAHARPQCQYGNAAKALATLNHNKYISNTTTRPFPRSINSDPRMGISRRSEYEEELSLRDREQEEQYLKKQQPFEPEDKEDLEFLAELAKEDFEEDPNLDDEGTSDILVNTSGGTMRLIPSSPSYFTGAPGFYDAWVDMQKLLRTYETYPTVPAAMAPRVHWKTLAQFRTDVAGTAIQASKYKKVLNILNRLNRIDPRVMPQQLKDKLVEFHRPAVLRLDQSQKHVIDEDGRAYAIGRRKESSARVWLIEGTGQVVINGKPLSQTFKRLHDRESVIWPLMVSDRVNNYSIWALVQGGGTTGQAEALTLGIARALMIHEPLLKPLLRRGKFL